MSKNFFLFSGGLRRIMRRVPNIHSAVPLGSEVCSHAYSAVLLLSFVAVRHWILNPQCKLGSVLRAVL